MNVEIGKFVVLATKVLEFDTFDDAAAFAKHNYPSVICERILADGRPVLRERARFDMLFDRERREWRVMLG